MSREDVVAVASRLFAIFLVVSTLRTMGSTIQTERDLGSVGGLIYYTLPIAIPSILAAGLLWYFPLTIARKLLPVMRDSGPATVVGNDDIAAIAFSVLGMWTLASAISDAAYWVVFLYGYFQQGMALSAWAIRDKARLFGCIAQIVIGLYLLFGANNLSAFLYKIRQRHAHEAHDENIS
jgi:hypothetical protein